MIETRFTVSEWIDVCAVADAYGFSPRGDCWVRAMEMIAGREGKDHGLSWWNASVTVCHRLPADQAALFADALEQGLEERFETLKGDLADALAPQQRFAVDEFFRRKLAERSASLAATCRHGFEWHHADLTGPNTALVFSLIGEESVDRSDSGAEQS